MRPALPLLLALAACHGPDFRNVSLRNLERGNLNMDRYDLDGEASISVGVGWEDRGCLKLSPDAALTVDGAEAVPTTLGGRYYSVLSLSYGCDGVAFQLDGVALDPAAEASEVVLSDRGAEHRFTVPHLLMAHDVELVATAGGEPASIGYAPALPAELGGPGLGGRVSLYHPATNEQHVVCTPGAQDPACTDETAAVDGARVDFTMPDVCVSGTWAFVLEPIAPSVGGDEVFEVTARLSLPLATATVARGEGAPACDTTLDRLPWYPPGTPISVGEAVVYGPPLADGFFAGMSNQGVWVAGDPGGLDWGDGLAFAGTVEVEPTTGLLSVAATQITPAAVEDAFVFGIGDAVTPSDLGPGTAGDLVHLVNVTVGVSGGEVRAGPVRLDDAFFDLSSVATAGSSWHFLAGVVDHDGEEWVLLPRSAEDFVP